MTLVILNPHAGGGRAGRVWRDLEPILWKRLGRLVVAVTERPQDVVAHLDKAADAGLTRVIAIGGDGTNHVLVNALAHWNNAHPDATPFVYGNLPLGTGQDWARGLGAPRGDLDAAAQWIAEAQPQPTDLGKLTIAGGDARFFLNIASAGLGGTVDRYTERVKRRRAWTFLRATIGAILTHQPQPLRVRLDGGDWYEGRAYLVAVANGTTFGRGMRIAPHAVPDDGLFDVVLVRAVSPLRILGALRRVYDGSHLTHPAVLSARARTVDVVPLRGDLDLDLDGEYAANRDPVRFTVAAGALAILR